MSLEELVDKEKPGKVAEFDIQNLQKESRQILKEKMEASDRIKDYKIQLRKAK